MARIRSIHPSLWTDADFVGMSAHARLFLIGLWNEADDFGVLAWKPLDLKIRLAPGDNIDPAAILAEIEGATFIVRIERSGKPYGVLKNFRLFQRPQRPSAPIIKLDATIAEIIGLDIGDVPEQYRSTHGGLHEPSRNDIQTPKADSGNDPAKLEPESLNPIATAVNGSASPHGWLDEPSASPPRKPDPMERRGVGEEEEKRVSSLAARESKRQDEQPFEVPDDEHVEAGFERFKAVFPKLDNLVDAQAEWMAATLSTPIDEILAGAKRYARSVKGTEARFIVSPAKWLAKRRWTDVIPEPEPPKADEVDPDVERWRRIREHHENLFGKSEG